ncbi:MAG: aryl-sulfate sulfotransferase [Pseudomonadota bacterium]|nr:aryl-sulfate sulfotransferase [Pseudomonadota bacterium]
MSFAGSRSRATQLVALGLAILPALLGCVEQHHPQDDGSKREDDFPDPVDGCVPGDGPAMDVEASLTDIATVVRVTWNTAEPTQGAVHFTTATGPRQTSPSSGTEHEVLLLGNRANTDVPFRVVTDESGLVSCGDERTITTGALPPELPDLTVLLDPSYDTEDRGYTVVPVIQQPNTFLVLLDSEAQYVWAWDDPEGMYRGGLFNADVDLSRGGIYANEQAESAELPGAIRHVAFDGTLLDSVNVEGGHTDFVELPTGEMASLSWDIREVDGGRYLGDRIVEVDAAGASRTVWSVWDHYTPDPDGGWAPGFYRADPEVMDWSHVNALAYDAGEDAYFLSMAFNQSVARVERSTGAMTWVIGGDGLVESPHSVQPLGDSVLVFNRGSPTDPDSCSEATEIDITKRAVVWSYRSEPCLLVPFLGSALRLPNGNTLVDWSSAGQLDEVTHAGELVWRVSLDLGAAFGFADRVPSLYPSE